jgi:phage repressor protein C with HTH and peptisase S24 domain
VSTGSRIRQKREELGWSQAELAAAAQTNQPTVDRIERGETRHSKHLNKILVALGLEERAASRIPVVGYIGGGQQVFAIDDHPKGDGIDEIDAPPGVENGIALIIRGDSMAPRYEDGDIVVIEKTVFDITCLIGRTCYVKLIDGRCYLKTLAAGSRPGRYSLLSSNGPAIHDAVIEQAYPVAWVRPKR